MNIELPALPEQPTDWLTVGYWALATGGVVAVAAAYLSVLYHVVDVVGGVVPFVLLVAGALVLAAVFRFLPVTAAIVLGVVLLSAGLAFYLLTLPSAQLSQLSVERVIQDTVALLTGYSVLRMRNVQNWALAVTAGPTFLTAYFLFRTAFRRATAVAAATLGFFVLTGDSGSAITMVGVVGSAAALGFSSLARFDASRHQGEVLAGLLGLMIISAGTVTAVPGGASPLLPPGTGSTSGDLVSADDRVSVGGSLTLSPEVLFTVESTESTYWRAAAYDRFTGSAWLRTGPRRGEPPPRPGDTRELRQVYTFERSLDVYPAAPSPQSVTGVTASVTEFGDIQGRDTLDEGDRYVVLSDRPNATLATRQAADGAYPPSVTANYLQVPSTTSGRVSRLAEQITADADTPHQKARAIETWLEDSKGYSLQVPEPQSNVVDQFLFEMESGYCVYFASSMAVMLRTQGVPARYVVGYTSGQQVGDDQHVVRGLDSHAWVEVYLPDIGWVRYDPTPAGPRIDREHEEIREARQAGIEGVDTLGSESVSLEEENQDEIEGGEYNATTDSNSSGNQGLRQGRRAASVEIQPPNSGIQANLTDVESGGNAGSSLPPAETIGIWAVLAIGLVAGARRVRFVRRLYRFGWLLWLPRGPPAEVVEGAFDRVLYTIERSRRERGTGETVREYVLAVSNDDRVHQLLELRERAVYANQADETAAETARRTARAVLSDGDAAYRFFPSTVFNRLIS